MIQSALNTAMTALSRAKLERAVKETFTNPYFTDKEFFPVEKRAVSEKVSSLKRETGEAALETSATQTLMAESEASHYKEESDALEAKLAFERENPSVAHALAMKKKGYISGSQYKSITHKMRMEEQNG